MREVVDYMAYDRALNFERFASFMERVGRLVPNTLLVLANLSVHFGKAPKEEYSNGGMFPIFSFPYAPQLNAIELTFVRIKQLYKKEKHLETMLGIRVPNRDLVELAIRKLKPN